MNQPAANLPALVPPDRAELDLLVRIDEGDQYKVGRLEFEGNTRTRDKVLRREFRVQEGTVLNMGAVKSSLFKINQLGYFKLDEDEPIGFENFDSEAKTVDLTVHGEEADRTELQVGGGYSEGYGWFGQGLTARHLQRTPENRLPPFEGPALSVLDQLSMLAGLPTPVPVLGPGEDGQMVVTGERVMNPGGVRCWTGDCPFEAAGIYRVENGRAVALRDDAFNTFQGQPIGLSDDAYGPFFHKVADGMRQVNPGWALFAEMDPFASYARRPFPHDLPTATVNASHWYDARLLHTKDYDANADADTTSARYQRQLDYFRRESAEMNAPTLIGEFGIPYDLDNGEAYAAWRRGERQGIWAKHEAALGAILASANIDGTRTPRITKGFGIASVQREGVGDYVVVTTRSTQTANDFSVFASTNNGTGNVRCDLIGVNSVRLRCFDATGNPVDVNELKLLVVRVA